MGKMIWFLAIFCAAFLVKGVTEDSHTAEQHFAYTMSAIFYVGFVILEAIREKVK